MRGMMGKRKKVMKRGVTRIKIEMLKWSNLRKNI
jgi:hypothetical protein